MSLVSLPLAEGSEGPDVGDLQRRLEALGFDCADAEDSFGPLTRAAVEAFQRSRGLRISGICDLSTWHVLVESDFSLGDRLLCLRSPMQRGDDVADLQLRLGILGFDPGRVDGIFGSMTQNAVGEFQRNAGLVSDAVCGPESVAALLRLEGRGGRSSVTGLREREQLRRRTSTFQTLRVGVGCAEESAALVSSTASALQGSGATVLLLEGLEWSAIAAQVNSFGADVFIGFMISSDQTVAEANYFSGPGYESPGGRKLAEMMIAELPASSGWGVGTVVGMRLPILRETRPPAVIIRLGTLAAIEASSDLIVAAVHTALSEWMDQPV